MKKQLSIPTLLLIFLVFLAGIAAAIAAGPLLEGSPKQVVTVCGTVVSFVTSTVLMKQRQVRDFLGSRPVLWFLFLFNALAAVGLYLFLDGAKGIMAAGVMGLVSIGAGTGLLRGAKEKPAPA
ncbi:hypothetical protein [Streptomyces geranii]|uniref:hypothetical protein n=1 Tax=Streptomyces geranii TaxID=2058923 RepID=UPI001E63235A|nr:hypothetical protein [Streptomyces geranii]